MKYRHQPEHRPHLTATEDTTLPSSGGQPPSSGLTRRDVIRTVGAGIGLSALPMTSGPASADTGYWTVAVMPDTQFYTETDELISYAHAQTQWVVDNRDAENIRFVTHEGDLVEHGDDVEEWDRIDSVMSRLDGVVPYSAIPGNHDWARQGDRTSSIENFRTYFGASRYDSYDWFGGSGPREKPLNFYQYFSGGDYEFLHLALELEPPGETDQASTSLGWAQRVLDSHRFLPTVLTTHYYLRETDFDDGLRSRRLFERNKIGNTGQQVWQKLVSRNPQVFLVFCGHFHKYDGEYHQTSTNDAGLPVFEALADYQHYPNGGNGWMRLVQFVPGGGAGGTDRIRFVTYSPSLDEYQTDADSRFHFDLRFDERFDPASWVGDVDGDGDLDGDDVARLQNHLAGQGGSVDGSMADVNGDGRVDIADAVSLNNYLGGH